MPVCTTDAKGGVNAGCYNQPSGASQVQLQNWALEIVTGRRRTPEQLLSPEDHAIIASGSYRRSDGTLVNFRMPSQSSEGSPFRNL
jgi:hypothetical protein